MRSRHPVVRTARAVAKGALVVLFVLAGFRNAIHVQGAEPEAVVLPEGVRAVWEIEKAHRVVTPTRERIWLNGLWRWRPAEAGAAGVPASGWGYFKVPGCWPGITDYLQKDSQVVFAHPSWASRRMGELTTAWYEREITVPASWAGRRIELSIDCLQSLAAAYLDGRRIGEIRFPGGELDLTEACRPGATHRLSLEVSAVPLKGVLLSYSDSASAREVRGSVARRGLCGDVTLVSMPKGPRLADVRVEPSVRRRRLTIGVALDGANPGPGASLFCRVLENGREIRAFAGSGVPADDGGQGRVEFSIDWMPDRLWDIRTPGHRLTAEVSLRDEAGGDLDVAEPVRFGFREFWIEGRDFVLNGKRIHLSAVPLDNAQVGTALATYEAARESLERLRDIGINYVYTHHYDCLPGSHLAFDEILRAADDVGMLVGFTQPHFSHYDWRGADAERTNAYAGHAAYYVKVARHHPAVVMYATSHNATGYSEDMNPDLMDGIREVRDAWARRNAESAVRAEAIVRRLDPTRVVYHHASGNLGSMHVVNFYPNFVPIQELSDWFGPWAARGTKPVFLCEYGAPFTWDWTMYRGWYRGQREFGSARVPWEFCHAEWNAQFLGDRAYRLSEEEKSNVRWEAEQFRAGRLWHRWDYPHSVSSTRFDDRYEVMAAYLKDNWRAFRGWGVSGTSPWEYEHFWRLRAGVDRSRKVLPVDWDRLQRPGFSPDFLGPRYERMDLAYERSDWEATPAAEALVRHNRPVLAFLAGPTNRFTTRDHQFRPGETPEKSAVVINDGREAIGGEVRWRIELPDAPGGTIRFEVEPGEQVRLPLRLPLPPGLAPGRYPLQAEFVFDGGERQEDTMVLDVLSAPTRTAGRGRWALFDPKGETRAMLDRLGWTYTIVGPEDDPAGFECLAVGKGALDLRGRVPDLGRVRDGLRVVVFEQTAEALERRLGFRVAEYGFRQVFPRVPDHPVLAGLGAGNLRDWRGEATLVSARLRYELDPRRGPTVQWCGLTVPRLWRCGNVGNVASVSIEKPARGDFLPIVDAGFALQYSPLLEYREGRGRLLFCQLDVTGRSEADPAADTVVRNLLDYLSRARPEPGRKAVYVGDEIGREYLAEAGLSTVGSGTAGLMPDDVLVVGPGGARGLSSSGDSRSDWVAQGGRIVGIGLGPDDVRALAIPGIRLESAEHIGGWFESEGESSPLAGLGPADIHNRDPRDLFLVRDLEHRAGDGVLAWANGGRTVIVQMAPWAFRDFGRMNVKRTFRRAAFLVSRVLANQGVAGSTPLLERWSTPVATTPPETRWRHGLYLDEPEEWDDPYRFFRW